MRKFLFCVALCAALGGCVSAEELAKIDDAKCRSYGAQPGEAAYVTCRSQLDAARTQARATRRSAPAVMMNSAPAPSFDLPAEIPTSPTPHF